MTIAKQIAAARAMLPNKAAYARAMSANIRAAMSDRAATQFRVAVMVDGCADAFTNWASDCPIAKSEA